MSEQLLIYRIDKSLPLPAYQTQGSVGIDCIVRKTTCIAPYNSGIIPLNTVVNVANGTCVAVLPRSSTFRKTGLILANSIGVIDQDYCGEKDEVCALVYNTTGEYVVVDKGARLFQLLVLKIEKPEIVEKDFAETKNRGGFGSTDFVSRGDV